MARTRCHCGGPVVTGEGYEVCSACSDTRKAGEMHSETKRYLESAARSDSEFTSLFGKSIAAQLLDLDARVEELEKPQANSRLRELTVDLYRLARESHVVNGQPCDPEVECPNCTLLVIAAEELEEADPFQAPELVTAEPFEEAP